MRLLRLYPRRWRDRYESEMRALLEEHPVRPRTLTDLLAGALRARVEEEESMARTRSANAARCSFCGKGRDQVTKLIAGPGVYICDKCIELCNEVLASDAGGGQPPAPAAPPRRPRPNLPVLFRTLLRTVFRSAAAQPG